MRSRMSLFVPGLSRMSSKEGKAVMLIRDMDIARLMIHVQQVEEDELRDREEFRNRKSKTTCNEFWQQKGNANRSSFQQKPTRPAPSSSSAPALRNRGYFKCVQTGHFMREFPKNKQGNGNEGNRAQSSSAALTDRVAPRGATSGIGEGVHLLYTITSHQEKEKSPDVVTSMIKVFTLMYMHYLIQVEVYLS
uniref:Gag-pol polyprotein n=1 Tax=Solanum tuberosum TaxID=4113 RepID=M1DKN3_SOLTU